MKMVSIVCVQVCVPTMYLCDDITTTIIMQNMANSITARDFINNMLEQNNKAELSRLTILIGTLYSKQQSMVSLFLTVKNDSSQDALQWPHPWRHHHL